MAREDLWVRFVEDYRDQERSGGCHGYVGRPPRLLDVFEVVVRDGRGHQSELMVFRPLFLNV